MKTARYPLPAKPGLILTKAQAGEIFDAMCHLNNIGVRLCARGMASAEHPTFDLHEAKDGRIVISKVGSILEFHGNQNAFATAYGLQ